IGNYPTAVGSNFGSNAYLADFAYWSGVTLTVNEAEALYNGARPNTIRPSGLGEYYPIDGLAWPEPDLSGSGLNGTVTGTTGNGAGPPIMLFTPRWPQFAAFTSVTALVDGWEVQAPQPPHRRLERGGALFGGDLGTEGLYAVWKNSGWEVQPPPPPHRRPERGGALFGGDSGVEGLYAVWKNGGWEIQPPQPPHPRPERGGAIMLGEQGIEATFV